MFAAFTIVYKQGGGWNQGVGGLAFMGIAGGMVIGVIYPIPDNVRYTRTVKRHGGFAPPEARLPPVMLSAVCIPVGLFYTIFAASVLAANAVLRSLFGGIFPALHDRHVRWFGDSLGTLNSCSPSGRMYAISVYIYRYGKAIRKRCPYSAQSQVYRHKVQESVSDGKRK
ncbi:hypothetical protein BBP40_009430 [Aspergillus hancockii]|nr:hypothetical protein BBP40_009430 [Aspergillus hancockii]